MEPLRSARLEASLTRAADAGDTAELFDLLERGSGLPGPRPNLDLARAVGHAIAALGGRADRLVATLSASDREYLRIVAAMALAARSLPSGEGKKRRSHAAITAALASLQELAEDPRHTVRLGIVDALRGRLAALGESAVEDLAAWTDGYLQAHVALEALADRDLLARLPGAEPVIARLDEAFRLADESPRAAERLQGVRALRQGLPAQIAAFAARFPEALAWVEQRTASTRPETREVVQETLRLLRRSVIGDVEAGRLTALLEASGKPRRDAARVVHGTRKRGKGRL